MTDIPKTLPRFLWHYCKRAKPSLFSLIALVLIWASTVSLNPYALKLFIDGMGKIDLENGNLMDCLGFPTFFFILLTVATSIILRLYDWTMLKAFPQIKSQITSEMFAYLEGHSYSYMHHNFLGSLANKINDIAKGAVTIVHYIIDQFCSRIFSFMVAALTMLLVHPLFSICLIIWCACIVKVSMIFSKKAQKHSSYFSHARNGVAGKIVDSISNILNVKLFAREAYENRVLSNSLEEMVSKERSLQWFLLKVKAFYGIAITILTGCMILLIIYERSLNRITIGDSALILTLTLSLIRDIFIITNQLVAFSEEIGICKQAISTILSPYELTNRPDGSILQVTDGKISFDQVHFKYKRGQDLFVNKSVTISGGSKVGLVGLSGSGKTTFVNLLLRFYDVDSGKISIDGQNIKEVTQESLRTQIAMIPQDPVLFHRSLMDNIRYGRLDATDEEVIECAKKAHCHEFIIKLKDSYNSLVGERGVKLSGGQRQCIAIARAMLKNAPILIFDEATSSLDSVTESYIQKSLPSLMKNKTTIIIAHRLSTLHYMDRILVFNEGKIVEEGTHSELINLDGHYKTLWNVQVNSFSNESQPSSASIIHCEETSKFITSSTSNPVVR
jgi:ATP-binding cassette subfamily B protein